MIKEPTELSETIKCGKKECECDIPVIDCYFINKPEVPQIGIKCPECGKVTTLSKAKSVAYAAEYTQIQEDIDTALGYKTADLDDLDEFGDRVMRALDAFGYKHSKHTQVKRTIREMVDNVPSYQSFQGLQTLLINMKIKPQDAMMVTQRVFATEQPAMLDAGMQQMAMIQPGPMYPPQMPYQQPMGQPQMPYPQQMPPQMPYQQPMQQPMPQMEQSQPAGDEITIVEKIGDDGQVIERVIKQPKAAAPEASQPAEVSMVDQFKEMIEVMTGAGMIRTNEPAADEAKPLTAEDLGMAIAQYADAGSGSDDKYDGMMSQIDSLKAEIRQNKEANMQSQIDSLKADVSKKTTDSRLSDSQYADGVKKDIESMRVEAVSDVLDKLATPLMEMQANQSRLQTAMMISELEKQRGAPPGSYAGMFGGTVSDDEVAGDLDKWREKAEKVKA
jgi:hypothetical protein